MRDWGGCLWLIASDMKCQDLLPYFHTLSTEEGKSSHQEASKIEHSSQPNNYKILF